ncbi:MAG: class I SAM-dependent methyltransferase [Polyangiales bacterium]
MAHVCPWWFVRSFDNPIRRLLHDPEKMFGALVRPGMRVLDVGCGAGFNTEGLARLVGHDGLVVAVDLQPRMLAMTKQRLERDGLLARAELIQSSADDLGLGSQRQFGFATAFWMVHEVPDHQRLFKQLYEVLEDGASLLVCEPKLHVSGRSFEASIEAAQRAGFNERDRPTVALSRAVRLVRP